MSASLTRCQACTIDPTSGLLYVYQLNDNVFTVVTKFDETIAEFARGGWTEDVIDGSHVRRTACIRRAQLSRQVKILTNARTRLFELDGLNGTVEWLVQDSGASDSPRRARAPIYGSRTEYTFQVFNTTGVYAEVCMPRSQTATYVTPRRCCATSRMPTIPRPAARLCPHRCRN